MPLSLLLALATAQAITQPPDVLVTGATGRLGSLLYAQAKADTRIGNVRAFVTNATKARAALGCQKCDPSEGIYVGDVRNPLALNAAANGVDAVLVAVGASPSDTPAVAKAIEVDGVENTARAIYASKGAAGQVVLCSSMGTTLPSPDPRQGGSILFYKLNAEASLLAADVNSVVVKPCGLSLSPAGQSDLLVGQDDSLLNLTVPVVARADVARVMIEATVRREAQLRFDLCARRGAPTTDLGALLDAARYLSARR